MLFLSPFMQELLFFFYNLKHLQSEFSSLLHHGTTVYVPASRCNMLAAVENGLTWLTIKSQQILQHSKTSSKCNQATITYQSKRKICLADFYLVKLSPMISSQLPASTSSLVAVPPRDVFTELASSHSQPKTHIWWCVTQLCEILPARLQCESKQGMNKRYFLQKSVCYRSYFELFELKCCFKHGKSWLHIMHMFVFVKLSSRGIVSMESERKQSGSELAEVSQGVSFPKCFIAHQGLGPKPTCERLTIRARTFLTCQSL